MEPSSYVPSKPGTGKDWKFGDFEKFTVVSVGYKVKNYNNIFSFYLSLFEGKGERDRTAMSLTFSIYNYVDKLLQLMIGILDEESALDTYLAIGPISINFLLYSNAL
jgi:hypothetical protein